MPLSEVQRGMRCTGYTVVRGTDITSFDAEVLDVVDRGGRDGSFIFIRTSGAAVAETGVGNGFSGSPIYCPDRSGVMRNAGAIAEGLGDYGNQDALAAPIERILGEKVDPPVGAKRVSRAFGRPHTLASPLVLSGASSGLQRTLTAAGRRVGRPLVGAPAGPLGGYPPQTLRPGASVAAGLFSGDVSLGAVGTVAYTDADRVWAFAHPFDGAGRRSLLLQDAYVYGVIGNPNGFPEATSYKFAAPGHELGTLTNDAPAAVVGRVGPLPAITPLTVFARDLDTGRVDSLRVRIPDESSVGQPAGLSGLRLAGPVVMAEAAYGLLRAAPSRLSSSLCLRFRLREVRRPLRFCNRYVVGGQPDSEVPPGFSFELFGADYDEAVRLIDSATFAQLHVLEVNASLELRRGLRQAFMVGAKGPSVVRPGGTARVRLTLREVRGRERGVTLRVPVPRDLRPGRRVLRLTGTAADPVGDGFFDDLLLFEDSPSTGGDAGPSSLDELAREVRKLGRYDGVRASFPSRTRSRDRGGDERPQGAPVYRDPSIRISGSLAMPVRVTRP